MVFPSKSVPLRSVETACTNDCGTERSGDGKYSMAREIAMFKWCSHPKVFRSAPYELLVPMIVARSGPERGNIQWLEKLQCSSGVPIIVKSVPLHSVGTACTNDCGTERSGDGKY